MSRKKHYPPINYTSRDFNSIKRDLTNYAQRYYPDTFQDFSESGFGSLMLDTVSYVGDILSFYIDYNVNETFLDTALEYNNVLKIGKQLGYKFNPFPASFGVAIFYIIVPAAASGVGPDPAYIPILKQGTRLSSDAGIGFSLNEDVDFAKSTNEIVIARSNDTNGAITSYAIKATGQVISGDIERQEIVVGDFQKFLKKRLNDNSITEVISVVDSEGNEYFEVDYLSQDIIYKSALNRGASNNITTQKLIPQAVPRRFVVERTFNNVFLQFGYGSTADEVSVDPLIEPSQTILQMHGRNYVSETSFDPSNFIKTDKFGIVPANTTLTVTYRTNRADSVNVGTNSLINVTIPLLEFKDLTVLTPPLYSDVINSLEVSNDEPIVGDVTLPNTEELKTRIYNVFSTQNRAVTLQDYKSLCYSMPPQFGAVKRVNVIRDPGSFRRNLNMYVISEDDNGFFVKSNDAIKENVKLWINSSRMINDTIDIWGAKIVNIGISFDAIASLDSNKYAILAQAIEMLSDYYSNKKFQIGDDFYVTEIYNQLNKMNGIIDVSRVKIILKDGQAYSPQFFDIDANFSNDGRYIQVPDNVIFEIKYPSVDIKGTIK